MGKKGDQLSKQATQTAEQTVERLSAIEGISSKKMFGGHGIFHDGKMFAMVTAKGKLAFKVNSATQEKYETAGAVRPNKMPYYTLPKEIQASDEEFMEWAEEAIRISKL